VPEDVVARHGLAAGQTVSSDLLAIIRAEAADGLAMEDAVRYLSHRPRTRSEVLRHLRARGHAESAGRVVERCESQGYVDDAAYGVAFARERIRLRPRGKARVVSELLGRGVDREIAEQAVQRAFAEEGVTEGDLLTAVARRRASALQHVERSTARRRLGAYLVRRGFPPPDVRGMVERFLPDEDDSSPA